jgi:hypothetical protein
MTGDCMMPSTVCSVAASRGGLRSPRESDLWGSVMVGAEWVHFVLPGCGAGRFGRLLLV